MRARFCRGWQATSNPIAHGAAVDVEHPRRFFDGVAVFALDQSGKAVPATRKQFMNLTAAIHAALRKRDGVTVVGGVPPRAGAWSNRAT
jgi:hypothetical protein